MVIAIPGSVSHQWYKMRDGSIEEFASRYDTTVEDIRKISGPFFEGKDISTTPKFVAELRTKHQIMVPVSSAVWAYDWEVWYFGQGTKFPCVDDLCKAVNRDLRREMVPALEAQDLILSIANISTLLELWKLHDARVDEVHPRISAMVSAYTSLCPGEPLAVLVPIPRVSAGIGVAVMPKDTKSQDGATPSVVEAAPPWLVTFYTKHLRPLDDALSNLVQANATCNRIKSEAASELAVFGALAEVARMMRDSSLKQDDPEGWQARDSLVTRMESFTRTAFDYMAGDVIVTLDLDNDGMRAKRAKDVLERIQDPEAVAGVVQILKLPDLDVMVKSKLRKRLQLTGKADFGKVSLKGYLTFLLLIAIQETMHSSEYLQVLKLIDRAFSKIGTAKKSAAAIQPDEQGWGDAILSGIGVAAGVATSLVGDAPGPQALGMAFACIAATYGPALTRLSFHPSVAWTGDFLTRTAGRVAGLDESGLTKLQQAIKTKVIAETPNPKDIPKALQKALGKELSDKITDSLWQSKSWNASMGVLAAISLLMAYDQIKADPMKAEADAYIAVVGAGAGFIAAGLKTIVAFEKSFMLAKTVSEVAGTIAAGLGVVVACWNLYRVYHGDATIRERDLALKAYASSWIVFIGFCCSSPGLQAIGIILGLYVLVAGMDYNEKSTFMAYLKGVADDRTLKDGSRQPTRFKQLISLGRNSKLKTAYTDLLNFADSFTLYAEIDNSPANRKRLAALRFTEQAIDGLTSYRTVKDRSAAPVPAAVR